MGRVGLAVFHSPTFSEYTKLEFQILGTRVLLYTYVLSWHLKQVVHYLQLGAFKLILQGLFFQIGKSRKIVEYICTIHMYRVREYGVFTKGSTWAISRRSGEGFQKVLFSHFFSFDLV
jgi:hypothetical protein